MLRFFVLVFLLLYLHLQKDDVDRQGKLSLVSFSGSLAAAANVPAPLGPFRFTFV
jgi:hypothetical protein